MWWSDDSIKSLRSSNQVDSFSFRFPEMEDAEQSEKTDAHRKHLTCQRAEIKAAHVVMGIFLF